MAIENEDDIKKVVLSSGIEVKPVYTPDDIKGIEYERDLGMPGKFPFTRGIHPLMYRKRHWTMRQYSGFGTAKETNTRFKYLLEHGQNALNVAFDLPTQLGLDSDDLLAEGEVGRVGMAVDTLEDMEIAFQDIPIDKVSTSLTINSVASVILAMYLIVAEKKGFPLERISGTTQNDILKEYIGRGTWIFPVEPSIKLIGDTVEFCSRYVPRFNPVSVCGYHIRESGANPVQEMAYAFEIAKVYIDHMLSRGMDIDEFAPRLSFNFDIFGNLFEEVAKFRAGRRLWAKILRDEYHAKDPRSMLLRMIAGGGGAGLTIQQPENNIVRGAYYALASALSGAQTMALCSYDEAYTIPTEKAAIISLRTMQILAEEVGVTDTVDPLAGSYYVETLTNIMEEKIKGQMKRVKDMGGIVKAIEQGFIQREVSIQAYEYEKKIQNGEIVKVGVNKYIMEEEQRDIKFHEFNPSLADEQVKRLKEIRKRRDNKKVTKCLNTIRDKAKADDNLMPFIIDAVKSYATLGEITSVLKDVYGTFREPVRI